MMSESASNVSVMVLLHVLAFLMSTARQDRDIIMTVGREHQKGVADMECDEHGGRILKFLCPDFFMGQVGWRLQRVHVTMHNEHCRSMHLVARLEANGLFLMKCLYTCMRQMTTLDLLMRFYLDYRSNSNDRRSSLQAVIDDACKDNSLVKF